MAYCPRRTLTRPRDAAAAAAAAARRTCCWRAAKITTVMMLAMCGVRPCQAAQRELLDITDYVEVEDLEQGGNCAGGCVRQVVDAVAPALGEIDCELRVENLLDHTDQDVAGGSLNVVHSCSDEDGNLLYQGQGVCLYSVCATARWEGDRFTYSVTVEHESDTFEPHSVRIQVYVNEYEYLLGATTDAGGLTTPAPSLTSASASSASRVINISCDLGEACSPASECNAITTAVEVRTEDEYGDGWAGPLPGRVDTWSITQALSASDLTSPVGDGSLPAGHYSAVTSLCLEDGYYTFTSTANSAWSSEATWNLCGVEGGSGGTLEFEVGGGTCKSVDDSASGGPASTDVKTSSGDYCSLPDHSPCVGLDVGVVELSGPSVGMYYDEACLEGGGGVSGCGGGEVAECRLCFVNREKWLKDFPDLRYPDWNDCPCCVAGALGVTCQGGLVETAPSRSFLEKAKDFYTGGSFAMVASVSGIIALGVLIALCCCRGIHKDQQKALTYKHSRSAIYEDYNDGGTSPDVSPPLRTRSSSAGPANPGRGRKPQPDAKTSTTTAARLSAAEAGKPARQQNTHKPRGKAPRREGDPVPPAPAATIGGGGGVGTALGGVGTALGSGGGTTAVDHHHNAPRRSALPPVEAPSALRLPGAAKDRPPSDASWPSDPRVGISVSGKKNPRWSGGRELKAYLRRTGYDKVEPENMETDNQKRLEGGGAGGNRMMQAMKSASSRLSEKSKNFDWVEDPNRVDLGGEQGTGEGPEMEGRQISMMDIMAALDLDEVPGGKKNARSRSRSRSPGIPLGDLPVQPPPPPGDVAPVPARITVARDKHSRSKSSSRPRPRGAGNGDRRNAAAPDDDPAQDRRGSSWRGGGSGKSRSRRVMPDPEEELHTLDKAFAEQNWNAPSADAPHAPVPPSPSTVRGDGAGKEQRSQRQSAGGRGNGHGTTATAAAAAALRAEAAEEIQKRRQERAQEGRGGADRRAERGQRSRSEAQDGQNRHRSTGEAHQHSSGHGQGQHQHRSGQGQGHQHRGRESERRGHGNAGGGTSNDASRGVRSKSNPAGPDRETEGERRRRRARDEGQDSSQGHGQQGGGRSRERRAHRSEHRSENRAGNGVRSSSQGQPYASAGREKSGEAHQERHERRKSAGRKDIHKMLIEEERRVGQERTSKSPGPPQERGRPRAAAREEKRASGGGGRAEGRPVAKAHVAEAVGTSASKKSSSTRFSSDPRARRERAEKLRQRQANATGRGEE